jgi:hypothetical protein
LVAADPQALRWQATTPTLTPVTVPVAWSPKWRVIVNGDTVEAEPSGERLVSFSLPAGANDVELRYERDVVDWLAMVIWISTVALFGAWYVRRRSRQRKERR